MESLDFVGILKLGFVGLGFLLAGLAYLLLKAEQKKDQPRPAMITPIYVFMAFALLLSGAAMYLQATSADAQKAATVKPYKDKLNKLHGLIIGKAINTINQNTEDRVVRQFTENLVSEIDKAKAQGLLD